MGVPYLNIHYQLMQSDLSAPKYTICLFLSYIFLCSHTWISAILVVSRVYYSCTSYSVISEGGIPFASPDFQNLTAPTFIMAPSLMFTLFCTGVCMCVCVSPKFQKQNLPLRESSEAWISFLKGKAWQKMVCSSGRFLVRLHYQANHFKTTVQAENAGRLPAAPSL